jgi:hypothetical protein
MSIVRSDPGAETVGVSPKVAWPTVALVALGALLGVLDKTGVIDVDDELWIALLGAGGGTGLLGAAAPAALQRRAAPERPR